MKMKSKGQKIFKNPNFIFSSTTTAVMQYFVGKTQFLYADGGWVAVNEIPLRNLVQSR